MKISVIVTTYNWLPALQAVIRALNEQQHAGDFEILVADDGSNAGTTDWLKQQKLQVPLTHVWQPDEGFRAAKIRNQAAAKAQGDYLIFLDGDCITPVSFLHNHRHLAEKQCFVSGNRVLLSQTFTTEVLNQHLPVHQWTFKDWWLAARRGQCNRSLPFLPLPLWLLNRQYSTKWQGAKTCNLAIWRDDFLAINGFDERYQGWGYEDSDLVIRLMRHGVKRKLGRFATPVLHLWHKENDRSKEQANLQFLQRILGSERMVAEQGVSQYF